MKFPSESQSGFDKAAAQADRFILLAEAPSTNDVLTQLARNKQETTPEFTVVVTDTQTAGRGRLGRTWVASSGKTLAISVLVRPAALFATPDCLAWLPLMSGMAMTAAVQTELDILAPTRAEEYQSARVQAELKWPNDVLVGGFKLSGILTELLPDVGAVVVGAGVNLTLDEHDLPTLTSTSLLLAAGAAPSPDRVLSVYLAELRIRYDAFVAHRGDARASGAHGELLDRCGTLGKNVRVELPGERELHGTAETIDSLGRLMIRDADGWPHAVAAGDVTHLRLDS